MKCHEVQEQLSEYIAKRLDRYHSADIDDHLSSCTNCRTEADDLRQIIETLARVPQLEPHVSFPSRVMVHVNELVAKPTFWQRIARTSWLTVPAQASAVVVIAVVAIYLLQNDSRTKLPSADLINGRDGVDTRLHLSQEASPSTKSAVSPKMGEQGRSDNQQSEITAGARQVESFSVTDRELLVRLRARHSLPGKSGIQPRSRDRKVERGSSTLNDYWKKIDAAIEQADTTGQPQSLSLVVDSARYDRLLNELSEVGDVEPRGGTASRTNPATDSTRSDELRVKVILMPGTQLR